jgi:hypothetical protein
MERAQKRLLLHPLHIVLILIRHVILVQEEPASWAAGQFGSELKMRQRRSSFSTSRVDCKMIRHETLAARHYQVSVGPRRALLEFKQKVG